jgi:hypothetical protein
MNTQNEFGRDAGRYVYRTHEVGSAAAGAPPRAAGGAGRDGHRSRDGRDEDLAERNDWERFDGIVWTPWGTILAAEEVVNQSARDPQVPQATAASSTSSSSTPRNPSRLDPSRERINRDDGTTDRTRDGIRVRPALGAKSHEGMRFDARGHLTASPRPAGAPRPTSRAASSASSRTVAATCPRAGSRRCARTTGSTARAAGRGSPAVRAGGRRP